MLSALMLLSAPVASYEVSGVPSFDGVGELRIMTHNASLTLDRLDQRAGPTGSVVVSAWTEVRTGDTGFNGRVLIPRRRYGDEESGAPTFMPKVSVLGATLPLRPVQASTPSEMVESGVVFSSFLTTPVEWRANSTQVVRMEYRVPIGRTGYEAKERIAGYVLGGTRPIRQVQLSFKYDSRTIFGLPQANFEGWQIGSTGAFFRAENWEPNGRPMTMTWYPPELGSNIAG